MSHRRRRSSAVPSMLSRRVRFTVTKRRSRTVENKEGPASPIALASRILGHHLPLRLGPRPELRRGHHRPNPALTLPLPARHLARLLLEGLGLLRQLLPLEPLAELGQIGLE